MCPDGAELRQSHVSLRFGNIERIPTAQYGFGCSGRLTCFIVEYQPRTRDPRAPAALHCSYKNADRERAGPRVNRQYRDTSEFRLQSAEHVVQSVRPPYQC